MIKPSFTNAIFQNVRQIPRSVIAAMFALAVIFALVDVGYWAEGWKPWPTGLLLLFPYALALSVVEYLGITGVLRTTPSMSAYIRFACTSALLILPVILSFGILFAAPIIGKPTAFLVFGVGVIAGIGIIAFLPAWPVAQAFSPSIVTPTKIFRASRGFRWGLIGAAILLSVFNRQDLVPAVDKAADLSHALAYAAGEAGMSTLSMAYTVAVAAAAFVFACRNDEGLHPPRDTSHPLPSAGRSPSSAETERHFADPDMGMFWKASVFWIVVLVGLTLVFFFVPAVKTIPQSVIVAFLVVIGLAYVFIFKRRGRAS